MLRPDYFQHLLVALYMSAWIEIFSDSEVMNCKHVALYMSTWIEIFGAAGTAGVAMVALYMSAWIEIPIRLYGIQMTKIRRMM